MDPEASPEWPLVWMAPVRVEARFRCLLATKDANFCDLLGRGSSGEARSHAAVAGSDAHLRALPTHGHHLDVPAERGHRLGAFLLFMNFVRNGMFQATQCLRTKLTISQKDRQNNPSNQGSACREFLVACSLRMVP